jgi:hypothetical protein
MLKIGLFAASLVLLSPAVLHAADGDATANNLSRGERVQIIEKTAQLIKQRYVDPAKATEIATKLNRDAAGDTMADTDPKAFAEKLTRRLRSLSSDGHFAVDYSAAVVPEDREEGMTAYDRAQIEHHLGADLNYGVTEVRRLDGNIGYLDLRAFAPTAIGSDVVSSAMTILAGSDALIIDLRHNGGGDGAMTAFLAAYILDQPIQMSTLYDRPTNRTQVAVTPDWVPGRRFGGTKPVYVLVSHYTFSAAEAFAYDLQSAGRIVVVGETTGGGAHPFANRRISAHFVLRLPEERVTNPRTGTDWEDVGVKPDVAVTADQALPAAIGLIQTHRSEVQSGQATASGPTQASGSSGVGTPRK